MKATVADRGQVTLPKALRDRLGIQPGMVLDFREEEGRLVAVKVLERSPVDAVYGILHLSSSTDELMRELRGAP